MTKITGSWGPLSKIHSAIEKNDIQFFIELHISDPNILLLPLTSYGSFAIHVAVQLNQYDITEFLLETHPEVLSQLNFDDLTPLALAVQLNRFDIARLLLKYGAESDLLTNHFAILNANEDMIDLLLFYDPQLIHAPTISNDTPLITAIKNGNIELVELLLKKGSSINHQVIDYLDEQRYSAVQLAIKYEDINIVYLLLKHANILTDDIENKILHHENKNECWLGLAQLYSTHLLTDEFFNAIYNHARPFHLALALSKLHEEKIANHNLNQALMAHPRPLSLAFALCRLQNTPYWIEQIIHKVIRSRLPTLFIEYYYFLNAGENDTKKEWFYLPSLASEHDSFPAHHHPAFNQSINQALRYHGIFSAKRSMVDSLSIERHQSPTAQHEYDKQFGLTLY